MTVHGHATSPVTGRQRQRSRRAPGVNWPTGCGCPGRTTRAPSTPPSAPIPVKRSHRLSTALTVPLTVVMLSGCGFFGPETFGAEDRSIEVDTGDVFELTLPANPSMGQDWSIARPGPDRATVRQEGGREDDFEDDGGAVGGGDGTQTFTFEAVAAGTTKIRMSYCVLGVCPDGDARTATGSPGNDPAYFIFTVTVR